MHVADEFGLGTIRIFFLQEKILSDLVENLQKQKLVEVTGVEPVTFCMPCKRSSQLS